MANNTRLTGKHDIVPIPSLLTAHVAVATQHVCCKFASSSQEPDLFYRIMDYPTCRISATSGPTR